MDVNQDRGLLDISVELSMRDIMAGNDFALFVFVKNPFTRPIWIRRVHVSLPSELRLANEEKIVKKIEELNKQEEVIEEKHEENIKGAKEKIESFRTELSNIANMLNNDEKIHEDIINKINELNANITQLQETIKNPDLEQVGVKIEKGEIRYLQVDSRSARIDLKGTKIDYLQLTEPLDIEKYKSNARRVELESSLPNNAALQPGNTAVYTVVLNVKGAMLFRPSKYRLQFNVNYRFKPIQLEDDHQRQKEQELEEDLFINTFAHEVSIRSSIYSIMIGSVIGGLLGGTARLIQVTKASTSQLTSSVWLSTIAIAIILSVMAIIFTARKSDAQSFVSVEDFWGGVLIGFLVGYSGTTFFESLTGIKPTS